MNSIEYAKFGGVISTWAWNRSFKTAVGIFDIEAEYEDSHVLDAPKDVWYQPYVSFRVVKNHPNLVRICSGNWRCEDEVNGFYTKEDARKFYRALLVAGFEVRTEVEEVAA